MGKKLNKAFDKLDARRRVYDAQDSATKKTRKRPGSMKQKKQA